MRNRMMHVFPSNHSILSTEITHVDFQFMRLSHLIDPAEPR